MKDKAHELARKYPKPIAAGSPPDRGICPVCKKTIDEYRQEVVLVLKNSRLVHFSCMTVIGNCPLCEGDVYVDFRRVIRERGREEWREYLVAILSDGKYAHKYCCEKTKTNYIERIIGTGHIFAHTPVEEKKDSL